MTSLAAPPWTRIRPGDLEKLTPRQQEVFQCRLSADPPLSYNQVGELLGMQRKAVEHHWVAIKRRLGRDPLEGATKRTRKHSGPGNEAQLATVAPQTTAAVLESKIRLMLNQITPDKVREEKASELARGVYQLVQARQIRLGEPTQILRVEERRHVQDLIPALLKEAERRGWEMKNGQFKRLNADEPAPSYTKIAETVDAEFIDEG